MTMLNRELFLRDPLTTNIPNLGVAKVGEPTTPEEWAVLRFEIANFVCEGEYRAGLQRILGSYLSNLAQPQQPAAWVSGFYGSGKSHLLRILEYLWRDTCFPDGATARGLAHLPDEIKAQFTELSTRGRQGGGLWSAAGTLSAGVGGSVRLALLGILFRSAGLPDAYPAARLLIWLRKNGYEAAVAASLIGKGRTLTGELPDMYVSPEFAESLRDIVPSLAKEVTGVGELLISQYPPVDDISEAELLSTMQAVLELQATAPNRLPCTVIIMDELQQYLGEDEGRSLNVQTAVEACTAKFGSRVLFVASGQSALQADRVLQKLQGRFAVRVELSDTDVEEVTRQVVLRKAPDKLPVLQQTLRDASGEIDRQLRGTRIAPSPADAPILAADYPLLPVRRRFWERVIRSVDTTGAAQLRTQLRVVHEATQAVAERPLGTVIAADVLYDQQRSTMLQTAALLPEVDETIQRLDDGTPAGHLRSRLAKLIFLISRLPTEGIAVSDVRPTATALGDLLVENLLDGDGDFRRRIPVLLNELVERGVLQLVEDEYRLQTRVSQEWDGDFRQRLSRIREDASRLAAMRDELLKARLEQALRGLPAPQGVSRTPRRLQLHVGLAAPATDATTVPLWVHDGWSENENAVREAAIAAGTASAVIHLFLPRRAPDVWRDQLARAAAAEECLTQRVAPANAEGLEAKAGMQSRLQLAKRVLDDLVADVLTNATIYLGGGTEVTGATLTESARRAIEAALARLYPKFSQANFATWETVFTRAGQGVPDPLAVVGYNGDAEKHPVCQAIRLFLGTSGKRGAEVRRRFAGPEYGWPQDAVDAALLVLMAGGFVRATRNGTPVTYRELQRGQISGSDFFSEGFTVTASQRLAVRGLLQQVGVEHRAGEEATALPLLLDRLTTLAAAAGGEPPLPAPPTAPYLRDLRQLGGNEQVVAVADARARLLADFQEWSSTRAKIAERLPEWQQLQRLARQAEALPGAQALQEQVTAIVRNRALLDDPNPATPLLTQVSDMLRAALEEKQQKVQATRTRELAALREAPEWRGLSSDDRKTLEVKHQLDVAAAPAVGTPKALLETLAAQPLTVWETTAAALPVRAAAARAEAARRLHPDLVEFTPPQATLTSEPEVDEYLRNLRTRLMAYVANNKPVLI